MKMLRNPLYVYGDDEVKVSSHLNLGQFLVDILWKFRNNVALTNASTHEQLTFGDMLKDGINIAISLSEMGVKRWDVVAICSENRQEYFSIFVGIICTGATVTTTNMAYTSDELTHVLNISKPKLIFCSPLAYETHVKTIRNIKFLKPIVFGKEKLPYVTSYDYLRRERGVSKEHFEVKDVEGQTETAVILYSSGTTGLPKGVMLTHLNIIITTEFPAITDPRETILFITPWFHSMGLIGTLRNFVKGSNLVYLPKFESDLYLQTIERYKIEQLVVAPPVLVALSKIKSNYDVSTVKLVYCGAAPLRDDTINAFKKRFPNVKHVLQGYGMTESTLAITRDSYDAVHLAKAGGVGRIIPSCIVKIIDTETNKVLGPNQPGEICVKGPMVMKGYINKDRREDFDDEGFFRTGDVGYYDDDKYFFIADRLKELIKYKGYQVAPAEIEALLVQHPSIRDAGVIGVPHESGGETPRAFVVIQPGANVKEDDVKKFIAERLSSPKHLRGGVQFVKEIPKNPSGKIMRKELRKMLQPKCKL